MRPILLSLSIMLATAVNAGELMCGSSPENDQRALALHQRTRARIASLAADPARPATLREGAFHLQTDDTITPGHRPFDLVGQSLVFTPAGGEAFAMRREALHYAEPSGEPVRDFQSASGADWHFVAYDLPFAFPFFGASSTRLYISAFNGIHTTPPVEQKGTQFDAVEAAVHRGRMLSPLMITTKKPADLAYPRVWIDEQPDAVIVTWRSSGNAPFGYDVQAKLAGDGTVTYSYRSLVAMHWGTPILTSGFDPASAPRAGLLSKDDAPNDVSNAIPSAVRTMLDVRRVDVQRIDDSDLFAVRITLGGTIDRTKLAQGQVLAFDATIGLSKASVRIDRDSTYVRSFDSRSFDVDGATAHVAGNVVEVYGVEKDLADEWTEVATTWQGVVTDSVTARTLFTPAMRSVTTDLSAVPSGATLSAPIAEPFVVGELDLYRVWDLARTSYGISPWEYDAVAIYTTFYTDVIYRAFASSTGGNAQVDGIAPPTPTTGIHRAREPLLMDMNQLGYGRSKTAEGAARVLLHEFGHRWLYRFRIAENGRPSSSLNPVSNHPAAYVHTPAAFPVHGENESSVMGGAYFAPLPDGSYQAHAANAGYSWTDLYLMGLAAPDEVPPWFYLAGTNLPGEYYAEEGAIVQGEKRDVNVGQIVAVHGPRIPSTALSQRQFRVLFVLVTENGAEATAAEIARLNEWRGLMEQHFAIATGGRGKVITTFVRPSRRRSL